jgi:branched-chain amino acid transport system permease protein
MSGRVPRMSPMPWVLTVAVVAALLVLPFVIPPFWTTNILGRAMVYGIIALSLTFLAHYGGFVSLAQMMIAGVAGYTLAVTVPDAIPANSIQLPYAIAIPLALATATATGLAIGAIAVRTREIYLLMITLAIAVGFYFFVQSNLELFNGYEGIRNILGPDVFGIPFRDVHLFYFVTLVVAVGLYGAVLYVARTPFGLVLQGIRDNARRVSTLGYNVALHRIAAFGFAGFIAGAGGVLSTIYNIGIAPGQISTHATITILIMAVIGGLRHPVGAFAGALIFTLVDTFSATIYDRDRFNTLIGLVFLLIVLASPDGVVGLAARLRLLAARMVGVPAAGAGRQPPAKSAPIPAADVEPLAASVPTTPVTH